jgi:hypothetical protein
VIVKVNINEYVKVKLNPNGIKVLEDERNELNRRIEARGGKGFGPYVPQVDEEGYTKFQLWHLMRIFGSHVDMGFEPVFETEILLLKAEPVE